MISRNSFSNQKTYEEKTITGEKKQADPNVLPIICHFIRGYGDVYAAKGVAGLV